MVKLDRLLRWTERLTGLERDRCADALERLAAWQIPHVTEEFIRRPSVDAVVGATLLVEDIAELEARDVPRARLLAKLRGDRECWSTWGEIHAACLLTHGFGGGLDVQLEPDRKLGRHADLRLVDARSGLGASIEIKTVGLSDQEVEFLRSADPLLSRLCPRIGFATIHGDLEGPIAIPSRAQRRERERSLRRTQRRAPALARGVAGATIVAHSAEQRYLVRVADRIGQALAQLPRRDDCWVALSWSNGAPTSVVAQALQTIELPRHVLGLMLVGSAVSFPDPEIHHYYMPVGRHGTSAHDRTVVSETDHPLAGPILEHFERSSGVRAILVRDPSDNAEVLRRGGDRRFFPFNLLLQPDPEWVATSLRTLPSIAQEPSIQRLDREGTSRRKSSHA